MKRIAALLLLILLLLPLTVSAQAQPDTVVLAFSRQPDSLLIDYAITSTAGFAMQVLYNSLVTEGPDGKVGELAESWEVSEDQLTWTFNLRQDVTWHDGTPFTAADVAFTFTFPASPDYGGALAPVSLALKGAQAYHDGEADSIEGIQVIDDYTIALTTEEPSALFLDIQGERYILPAHLLESVPVAELPNSPQARAPIGTGPYRLVEWRTDEALIYTRYDGYFGEPANITNYIWRIIPDQSVQITELLSGGVDIVPETLPDDFVTLEGDPSVTLLQLPGVNFTMLQFNMTKPFFQDVRVRQAINHAVDRDAIIAAVGGGFGIPVTQIVHPSLPEYNPNLQGFAFDAEQARTLLAEAGWTDDDGDGVVESHGVEGLEDGTPFEVELGTFDRPLYSNTVQIVQQNLADVGIKVNIFVSDFNTYFSEYLTSTSDYEMAISGWFAFEQIPQGELQTNFGRDEALNFAHWPSTDEFEQIIADAPTEFDPAARQELYWRAAEIIEENAVWAHLTRLDNLISYNANLQVPEVASLTELFASVPEWSWPG
jgi:peptide/nickel transport system substrate-binding protein